MKDKEKQIEEICKMAVMGCRKNPQAHTVEECVNCDFKKGMCDVYRVAEKIYENSVVLSREEYELLTNDLDKHDYGEFESGYSQGSKETAEKIFEKLYQWLDLENIEKYGFVTIQKFDFLRKFREIYKQFGVGIGEEE